MADLFCTNTCVILIHVIFVTSCLGSSGWQMHAAAFWPQERHRENTWEWWPCDDKVEKPSLRGLQLGSGHVIGVFGGARVHAEGITDLNRIFNWEDVTVFLVWPK